MNLKEKPTKHSFTVHTFFGEVTNSLQGGRYYIMNPALSKSSSVLVYFYVEAFMDSLPSKKKKNLGPQLNFNYNFKTNRSIRNSADILSLTTP